jgi:probable phosphoglycerate mutase
MTELILVRHGETAWNAERRLQGHVDTPLNDEGRRQARALAAMLVRGTSSIAPAPYGRLVSSDLDRTFQTARPIAALLDMEITRDPRLRERCFGAFEGLLYDEVQQHYPQAWSQWQAREVDARYPEGERQAETLTEFAERVKHALTDIASRYVGQRIIVVTHGGFLDCAYRLATGMNLTQARNFDVRNASINRFGWDQQAGLQLLEWGVVAHLATSIDEIDR